MSEPTPEQLADMPVLRDALDRLVSAAFRKEHPSGAPFSIPTNPRRDSDQLLSAALDELAHLREQVAHQERERQALVRRFQRLAGWAKDAERLIGDIHEEATGYA